MSVGVSWANQWVDERMDGWVECGAELVRIRRNLYRRCWGSNGNEIEGHTHLKQEITGFIQS